MTLISIFTGWRLGKPKTAFEARQEANLNLIANAKSPRQKHKPTIENRNLVTEALRGNNGANS